MKLLLLDCDGTIRESKSGERFIKEPRDQVAIADAVRAIKGYSDRKIYGITNQVGVGQGHKTLGDAIEEQLVTLGLFPEIKEILLCPDRKGIDCYGVGRKYLISYGDRYPQLKGFFRKPNDGMVQVIFLECGQIEDCLMVGDRTEDMEAAKKAGINFEWVFDWWC